MQEMPVGIPDLVESNPSKIDFPTLCADITKYRDAGLLSEEQHDSWKLFLASFNEDYIKSPRAYPEWPLPFLASNVSIEVTKMPALPSKIIQLHRNEATSIVPVSIGYSEGSQVLSHFLLARKNLGMRLLRGHFSEETSPLKLLPCASIRTAIF